MNPTEVLKTIEDIIFCDWYEIMIRHILIVAWRNICKYKVSAGIAVVGLAMGLLCFVLCNFCARLFFSIDKVFPNYDRMAEIQIKVGEGGELQDYFAGTPPTLAGDMETAFPGQIECCTAVSYGGQMNVTFERGEKNLWSVCFIRSRSTAISRRFSRCN